jgi:hypothetical protein
MKIRPWIAMEPRASGGNDMITPPATSELSAPCGCWFRSGDGTWQLVNGVGHHRACPLLLIEQIEHLQAQLDSLADAIVVGLAPGDPYGHDGRLLRLLQGLAAWVNGRSQGGASGADDSGEGS